jgi:acid phosphatase type 7
MMGRQALPTGVRSTARGLLVGSRVRFRMYAKTARWLAVISSATIAVSSCEQVAQRAPIGPTRSTDPSVLIGPVAPTEPAVFVGAGDIGNCELPGAEATAKLLDAIPGTVFAAGDNAYFQGTRQDYERCYAPTWGRHKQRTRPVPGNHEYETAGADGYFWYFGSAAAPATSGFYSYDLGAWHIVALNSNIAMDARSDQLAWLRADLAENRSRCTLAYEHHPLFSSGPNGPTESVRPLWELLYAEGADVVISGHDHLYERFAPQDPVGRADMVRGIRQFVVGTGGSTLRTIVSLRPNSEVRFSTWGVLKLTLRSTSYDWEFVPVAGESFRDSGSDVCR